MRCTSNELFLLRLLRLMLRLLLLLLLLLLVPTPLAGNH